MKKMMKLITYIIKLNCEEKKQEIIKKVLSCK